VEWSKVYYTLENWDGELVKKAYRQYSMKGKPVELINEMIEKKTFVTGSREMALALSMLSMSCHSDTFRINSELKNAHLIQGNFVKLNLAQKNINRQLEVGLATFQWVSKIICFSLGMDAYMEGKYDLQPCDVQILMLMIQHPNNWISVEYLRRQLVYKYRQAVIGSRTGYLFQKKYIDKRPAKQDAPAYRITEAGMLVVGELVNYVLNKPIK
jgi:hypothetical protein